MTDNPCLDALDAAMRKGHQVVVDLHDGKSYIGTVLHIASFGKIWMVVGDEDKFVHISNVKKVGHTAPVFKGLAGS